MLRMLHPNRARIEGDTLLIDRTFHTGMETYAEQIRAPIVSVHPRSLADEETMDLVGIPPRRTRLWCPYT